MAAVKRTCLIFAQSFVRHIDVGRHLVAFIWVDLGSNWLETTHSLLRPKEGAGGSSPSEAATIPVHTPGEVAFIHLRITLLSIKDACKLLPSLHS